MARPSQGSRGGDIYYFSVCDRDLLARIAIADVRGHGETVSAISQWLYHALALRMNDASGRRALLDLNARALDHGIDALTTAAVVSFDRQSRRLSYSSAGHPPAFLWQGSAGAWQPLDARPISGRNLPLGVLADAAFDESVVYLKPGDRFVLYTDGVTERWSPAGAAFGQDALLSTLNAASSGSLGTVTRSVVEALDMHAGGQPPSDDLTFIAVEVEG